MVVLTNGAVPGTAAVLAALALAGCSGVAASTGSSSTSVTTAAAAGSARAAGPTPSAGPPIQAPPSAPAVTESNPPGDIPDDQAFVAFSPPGSSVTVKVPEGWARTAAAGVISFTDKLNRIQVTVSSSPSAPTESSVLATDGPRLSSSVPAFAAGQVSTVSRGAGRVLLLRYQGDSAPDPVTGKVVRDAFEQYTYFHRGRVLTLTLSGPTNADNVDPWMTVSDSVQWR